MKKILSLMLTCALGLSLVACGGNAAPAETKPAGETTAAAEKPAMSELNVGVFYYDFSDVYISTVRSEMDKMLNELGVKFTNYDGKNDQPTQTDGVQTALTQGVNLLIVNVVETSSPDAAQAISEAAKNAGVPVIFFNREISDDVVKAYENSAFVGTNAPEAGHLQGEMIAQYLLENFEKVDLNKDGEISYVMFKGQNANAEAEARTQFSVEDADKKLTEAGKKPLKYYDEKANDKFLVDQNGAWSAEAAKNYMDTILSTYSEANNNMIEMVIANNDGMASGAVSALEAAGYNKDASKAIPVFGVDATDEAKQLIADGKMAGTIKQDNVGMASTIIALVKNIKEGKKIMDGTESFNVDAGVAKIRVPYQIYTGK